MPAMARMDAVTALQLIPGVRRTLAVAEEWAAPRRVSERTGVQT